MSKLYKLAAVIAVTAFVILLAVPTAQAGQCRPVKIAMSTPCVHDQMDPLMASKIYKMAAPEVFDNGGGMMTVSFYFNPKCLDDPIPCRIASRMVTATVDCNAQTATCP